MVRGPGASSTWAGELPVALAVSSSLSESLRAPPCVPVCQGAQAALLSSLSLDAQPSAWRRVPAALAVASSRPL